MQAIIQATAVEIVVNDEIDRAAVRRILSGARTDGEFLADLLAYAGVSGLYATEIDGDVDTPIVTDVPITEEDAVVGVRIWAYQGSEALGERLLRQGAASLVRVQ